MLMWNGALQGREEGARHKHYYSGGFKGEIPSRTFSLPREHYERPEKGFSHQAPHYVMLMVLAFLLTLQGPISL